MSPTTAIFKRELKGFFGTPLAYVFLALFLLVCAAWMFRADFWLRNEASMGVFFSHLPWLFAFFAPVIAMGMWAEERRTGTIEMLLTLPITTRQAILGKFLAGWSFMLIALLLTLPILFTIMMLGDPELGPIFTGYIGAALLSACYLAVSSFFSVVTKSHVISCVLAVIACITMVVIGDPSTTGLISSFLPEWMMNIFASLSFSTQFDVMQRGVIEIRNLIFMLVITVGFLMGSVVMLDDRKAA